MSWVPTELPEGHSASPLRPRPGQPFRAATGSYNGASADVALDAAVESLRFLAEADSVSTDEKLNMIKGQEIMAPFYEDYVGISSDGQSVIRWGEVVESNLSSKPNIVEVLFNLMVEQEGFGADVTPTDVYNDAIRESDYWRKNAKVANTYHIVYEESNPGQYGVDYLERETVVEADTPAEAKQIAQDEDPDGDFSDAEVTKLDE